MRFALFHFLQILNNVKYGVLSKLRNIYNLKIKKFKISTIENSLSVKKTTQTYEKQSFK